MNVFPKNEHKVERVIRVILGLGVLALFFVGPKSPWALFGLVLVVTGALGSCPLYTLFGISTCSTRTPKTAT